MTSHGCWIRDIMCVEFWYTYSMCVGFVTLWVLCDSGTLQVPLRLTVVSLSPERPALVLQQMTEMEIQVPENFPDEDDEELEDTEGDNVQTEHDDPDPGSASHKHLDPGSASPNFISRLASLFSTGDSREPRLKVVVHNQAYKISNV